MVIPMQLPSNVASGKKPHLMAKSQKIKSTAIAIIDSCLPEGRISNNYQHTIIGKSFSIIGTRLCIVFQQFTGSEETMEELI